ncbi:MAG: N-acetyltransferase [Actinobacteria bacterium]|nr:N-acetyltransferase [Actinomycetota bacterium]
MCRHVSPSASVPEGTLMGENCVIMEGARIGEGVEIGNNVVIHPDTSIGDHCHIGDNAVLGRQPRSGSTSIRKSSTVPGLQVGKGVVIGTSAVIYAGCAVGDSAMIADHACVREGCVIEEGSRIGRCVTVECNTTVGRNTVVQTAVHLTGDMLIEDEVFIGPEACFMNDKYMAMRPEVPLRGPVVRKGAAVGANATVLAGVEIGESSVVGAGAVVTRDVPPGITVVGNPARPMATGRVGATAEVGR